MNSGRISLKKKHLSEDEMDREEVGDRWTLVNVLPRSGFIQTVHHGKRTKQEGEEFIKTIKQNSDGEAPLFLSDGWPSYPEILASTYSHEEAVPYSGGGRPRKPIRIRDENLKYAQVIKHKEGGRLIEIEKRVVWGTEEEITDIIQQEGRGQTINTSYVESRNGTYCKDNKRLTRRSVCQSKEVVLHDAQIDFRTGNYNFVDENRAFRECINPNAKRFEVKYKKYSPAMLEGFADHCLTLEELLMWRVPK
jgi:IS1 family transposase